MNTIKLSLSGWLAAFALVACGAAAMIVESPDGRLSLKFAAKQAGADEGRAVYEIDYAGRTILAESGLGLVLDGSLLGANVSVLDKSTSSFDHTWRPVWGERSLIRDSYNELEVELRESRPPNRILRVTFRVYNEGVAWCYTIPEQRGIERVRINAERTEFRFLEDHTTWATYTAQGEYSRVKLSEVSRGCERPLTVKIADDLYVAVAEARLVDYARMKLAPLPEGAIGVVSDLNGAVNDIAPLTTPWRVVMVADSPGRLLESNDIILNLNNPCAIEDTSWIRPGKIIREVTLTTTGGKACIDFAVNRGLQFIEFDDGWYGYARSEESDARTPTVDPARSPGPLDLEEVIRYASERGIGVILYMDRRALERQLDEILPLYRDWGVKGVKFGFVNVGPQEWTSWLHEAVRKAADHRLMVDIHDEYRPSGYSRTYPNLMTQEGIRGDEERPASEQALTTLFTRMLVGAADNTICYYDRWVGRDVTHALQLAKAVCMFSPWQFLYWYDRPSGSPRRSGGAGGNQGVIGDEPELEFFDRVPTVWDDTNVLHGSIGEYAVIARRSGGEWYVGAMNGEKERVLATPLRFLDKNRKYEASIYVDDTTIETRTKIRVTRERVDANTVLDIAMIAGGGQAIIISPIDDSMPADGSAGGN